jgi:GAF domain-containing protein/nitrogen-specific signal transduction histidine kinase
MTATQDDMIAELQRANAELRQERDEALAREATLAEALATRNSEFGERIEYQAATLDVLRAMSASPGDPQPVFDLIVERARDLCEGYGATVLEFDGSLLLHRASTGIDDNPAIRDALIAAYPKAPERSWPIDLAVLERRPIVVDDYEAEPNLDPALRNLTHKSVVALPLMRGEVAIGALALGGRERGGFSDSQIGLLKTFAEQAVIAITSAETYRALQTRTSDLQETLEYQIAISDVLKVISRSAFDLQPVLDTVVKTAARLCNAEMASIGRREGDLYRGVAHLGFPEDFIANRYARGAMHLGNSVSGRAAREGRIIHVHDVADEPDYPKDAISSGRQRSSLGVPLLRDNEVIGVMILARRRVEPFTDQQIELVRTFADQSVIAIENTRLITEQREALEQQTATAEVLHVINTSPGNLAPVFDAILEKAHRLCGASHGALVLRDGYGETFRAVATHSYSGVFGEQLRQGYHGADNPITRSLIAGARFVHHPDLAQIDHPMVRASVELAGVRTGLYVPLRKDDVLLGMISSARREVRPFSDKEITLVENFAAQAVIAMENARLINGQREALEQQIATAEVLQVINGSPGDLTPVFDAVLEKAMRLCGAAFGSLYTYDGERFHSAAQRGVPPAFAAFRAENPPLTKPGGGPAILLETRRPHHVLDLKADETHGPDYPGVLAMVELGGVRTILMVPLLKDETFLGYISIYRQEVRAFSDKQIALLENFAAQAVIAMENARLITEQREALEQQTATAEVLQVINASPGNLAPVFDAMLEKALHLCEAAFGVLWTYDGERIHAVALRGMRPAFAEFLTRTPHSVGPDNAHGRLLHGEPVVHIADVMDDEAYWSGDPMRRSLVELGSARTLLAVPLRKDEAFLGDFVIYRQEARPFADKQIALLQNFAAQAVIAMENARLLEELRRRQEELRITFENMGDGVAMFDETQYLAAWNHKFQDILDLPDALLEQRRTYEEHLRFLAARGDFGPGVDTVEQINELVASTGKPYGYERTRPDGRVIEIRRNPVPGGGFVLIYSDITERKRSEEQIRAARDAAETALRELKTAQANLIQAEKMASLGQLTAGIAHEIKNPLNFVNNFAALSVDLLGELKETAAPGFAALTEKQRAEIEDVSAMLTSNLEKITEHGKRADGIVKAMLEHSRGSSGERRMVDLNALIDEALNLAYHGARAQDQSFNITLERDFGEGIAPIEVNPQDITRVFLNLFSNGFYATTKRARDGRDAQFAPTLKVTTLNAGEAVEIRVRDNGTGIPADIRDKLFQPFFTTKPTGEGTGLGLSITYDIVTKAHGGSIAVDSKVGDYSEFTIRLPRNL